MQGNINKNNNNEYASGKKIKQKRNKKKQKQHLRKKSERENNHPEEMVLTEVKDFSTSDNNESSRRYNPAKIEQKQYLNKFLSTYNMKKFTRNFPLISTSNQNDNNEYRKINNYSEYMV